MPKKNFAGLSASQAILLFCFFLSVNGNVFEKKYDESEGRIYLRKINADIQVKTTENVLASWAYESNITDENLRNQLKVSAKLANYTKEIWKETIKYPWKTFKDPDVRRQFQKFSVLGTAILSPSKYERFNKIISDMQSIYGKAKICNYHNRTDCSMQLEPELTEIFVKSRDPDELRYYWEQWRNVAGKPVRKMYKEYVDLSNEAAILNNFTNNAEFWVKDYEADDFKQQVEDLWQQLRPLYLQLHAYVRRRLREQYGERHVAKRSPIPAHLLGNMWAQTWGNIFDFVVPYPGKPSLDVTKNMVEQGYTPLKMFKLAEEFFTSLNLSPMPDTFWKNSILEKPKDGRDLICHASAWDFYDGKDFRIKQCTLITMEDLNTVHHEMGHIQYFLQYKNQPLVYKEGTNPGFHEAVGDVMALSVSTPKHLRKIGLLNSTQDDAESDINQLLNMALDKIAFLPFGYLMDQWRWSVFEGKTTEKNYNCKWWQLRERYQGLSPSVERTEDDFDPAAKYHTVGNVPYIRYFVSFVIQFQFHRSLCIAAKEFNPNDPTSKPLHKCDIYQSKEAGALLRKMLQMGSSKPWPDAMEVMTGQRKMDARALLDYFATLQTWLEKENQRTGEFIGWESSQRECVGEEQEENERGENASDTQGDFEDENIAHSYAEFVPQDDNSFGFPDYLEEIQPSYHALRHRLKKKYFQTNRFLPKRKSQKYYKRGDIAYLPDSSYFEDQRKFLDLSTSRHHKNRLEREPLKKVQNQGFSSSGNYKIVKVPTNEAYEKRTKRQEVIKNELLNAILRKVQYLKNNEDFDSVSLNDKGAYRWILRRDASKDKKNTAESSPEKSALENENKEAPEKVEKSFENPGESSTAFARNEFNSTNLRSMTEKLERENDPDFTLSSIRKKISENPDSKIQNELIWKAELVKNEARKMLESYNLIHNSSNATEFDISHEPEIQNPYEVANTNGGPNKIKTRNILPLYNTPEYFRPGKCVKINFNPFESYLKTSGFDSIKNNAKVKKHVHFKEYDLVGVIPLDDLFIQVENEKKPEEHEKHNVRSLENDKSSYVMLVGKLSENEFPDDVGFNTKRGKKSYKRYHYNVKTPVTYNAVVIASGGKADKPDETKDHWSKISNRLENSSERKRAFRKTQHSSLNFNQKCRREFYKNKFPNSVKNNKFNINNIVQYFGCLQLLLKLYLCLLGIRHLLYRKERTSVDRHIGCLVDR